MPTEKVFRAVVAILLGIEAAALLHYGATWFPAYIVLAVIVAGLVIPNLRPWPRTIVALVAVSWAFLFVFPGGYVMAVGMCGFMNSVCSTWDGAMAIASFAVAIVVNVAAGVLLVRKQ